MRQVALGPADAPDEMHTARHSPFALFRFALRERDWPLAALLARSLGNSEPGRRRLRRELEANGNPGPSLLALRVLGELLHVFGRDGARK